MYVCHITYLISFQCFLFTLTDFQLQTSKFISVLHLGLQDLEELLNRVNSADSALGIERSGATILERLQKAKERRAKITAEEMRTVMEERDGALARVRLPEAA